MSVSDSEVSSSSAAAEYKFFRTISHDRLLYEMLGSTKSEDPRSAWKVLIMDKVTMKVMSSTCKMADITDQGVSLVEELFKRRQPMSAMDVVYFMQPSKENIVMFISDMSGREPLYKRAYIFFSKPTPRDLVSHIKCDVTVVPRIAALREMNLEFFPLDRQAFVTDQDNAMEELFVEGGNQRLFDACLTNMAIRLGTVFASLKEFPNVRYRASKPSDESEPKAHELMPSKLAEALWSILTKYKSEIPNFPQSETCELLILDRSFDLIAPIIHEWTYDGMCHDLLDMEGNKCTIEIPNAEGDSEEKEIILEDHDPIWLELRHTHIADASERLYEKMNTFQSKNKAAQLRQSAKDGVELSTRDLQKMVQALPEYTEKMEKLTIHVEIAGKINTLIGDLGLRDLGQLEQDLVFGDAVTTDVINFLRQNQDATEENKLRLLMIYALVYPEKFEGDKGAKIMQLAKLSPEDLKVINNMKKLVGTVKESKKKSGFSLKFDGKKTRNAARKDRAEEEEEGSWQLFRFYPMLEELLTSINKGQLSKDEYQCMNTAGASAPASAPAAPAHPDNKKYAGRSRRTANWGRSRLSDDGNANESALKYDSGPVDSKKMGQRIFVFIIGGATRSELRACHKLTTKLHREIVLGTTCFDDPPQYIAKLRTLFDKEVGS